jgi:hypothetical protein
MSQNILPTALWSGSSQAGGEGNDEAFGIAADSFGDAYITGSFTHTANFGKYELTPVRQPVIT